MTEQKRFMSEWEAAQRAHEAAEDAAAAAARAKEFRASEARTVDAIAARIEHGLAAKSAEAKAIATARAPEYDAAEKIVRARMVGTGLQLKTVAMGEVGVIVSGHTALKGDGKGGAGVESFEVRQLFNRAACAVFRLFHEGDIAVPGVKAALAFAHAGDRVLGADRVRTTEFERIRGAIGESGLADIERDAQARQRWLLARLTLCREEWRVMDGVMRHDESAVAAASAAWPKTKDRKKLGGMGDWALIRACRELALAYGFETKTPVLPSLALS